MGKVCPARRLARSPGLLSHCGFPNGKWRQRSGARLERRRLVPERSPLHHRRMITFGFSTLLDLLSWVVAITLGLKVVATLILLNVSKETWDRPGWGALLWWSTKITPVIAVPCVICIAWLQGMTDQIWIFVGLMVFVMVAVPWKIRQRRARIADQATARSIS